jgi:hypothetical protein
LCLPEVNWLKYEGKIIQVALCADHLSIPSGKHTKHYGKSQFSILMGKSTNQKGHFQ